MVDLGAEVARIWWTFQPGAGVNDAGEFLRTLIGTVRAADLIDVLLVAVFLFIVITWLRQSISGSAARRVVVVGLPLLLVYFLANRFDLFLVESLLRVLLIVGLLALVVVFQWDLRRMLDRIGAWGFSRRRAPPAPELPNILASAAARMAETKTGALIAVRGAEPWDAHVQGGIELNGTVTRPLLYSIFSPDTPGHDGAVLIEGGRVTSFGVHLPLSSRLPDASRFGGTRHAAALGLAELCDAMVIVVSEERGTIGVAQDGELTAIESPIALRGRLEEFWKLHYSDRKTIGTTGWARRSMANAALSLAIAIVAWFLFAYSTDTVQRTFQLPIAFRNLPPEWALEDESTMSARVMLSGPEQAFRTLDANELVISFDLAEPSPGANELRIDESNVDLPSNVSLFDVEPQTVTVTAVRRIPVEVAVQVRILGMVPDTLGVSAEPTTVTVLVRENRTTRPIRITTDPVDIRALLDGSEATAPFSLPEGVRLAPGEPSDATVRLVRRPIREP